MSSYKPRTIRTLGIVIAVFAGFIVFGNTMGILVSLSISGIEQPGAPPPVEDPFFRHFDLIAFFSLVVGLSLLIGGIFIARYKGWARVLVIMSSLALIVAIWVFVTLISFDLAEGPDIIEFWPYLVGLCWSAPAMLLVWYLSKREVKKYFD